MAYETILFDTTDAIAKITVNRPKALNALNSQVVDELLAAVEEIEKNEDIRVLIITGAGEKVFVAGADITELAKLNPVSAKHFASQGHKLMLKLESLSIPVLAAVNGFALGGGLELALACDFIYASENVKVGQPEIDLGIIPGFGGTQRLARIVGKNMAKEMILTGMRLSAEEAEKKGIVNRVVPAAELMETAEKSARSIAKKGRVSVYAAKQAINNGLDTDLKNGCEIEINSFALCMASPDANEGTTAFLEKRQPEFKGSLKE
ncbi:MAG: enoyl-CoA hydratase/isomerase family protein [Desulfobacteraceae bacterium]|nr:enoyl-CoA hydratase/isomerase family protein [Desulfobacteraceae bacterium]MCF8093940.1 enoyl-CoA hydratase/isomerase family protein [Desulfobacteraceae bacterium]